MPASVERRTRILDAAAALISRYGYDKTTIDDIAREAGISKGAVYLEFRSKDELFEALLLRELTRYAEEWLRLIDLDPKGGTIGAMYKNSLHAMNRSPFMAAMFGQDRRVFGNYLLRPGNLFDRMQAQPLESSRHAFVRKMQEAGLIRRDLNANVIAHIMSIIGCGLLAADQFTPAAERPSLDATLEGIAAIMDAALTPEGVDSTAGKAVLHEVFEDGRELHMSNLESTRDRKE